MRTVVIYESIWGNTATIANTIARRLEDFGDVRLVSVLDAGPAVADGADLLVVGGPTHAHGMSRPSSRKSGAETETIPGASTGPGVREWLEELKRHDGSWEAAFDTRIDKPRWLVGAASGAIDRRLRKLGFEQGAEPASFVVLGGDGPLKAGEVDRADAWAAMLGQRVVAELAKREAAVGVTAT